MECVEFYLIPAVNFTIMFFKICYYFCWHSENLFWGI